MSCFECQILHFRINYSKSQNIYNKFYKNKKRLFKIDNLKKLKRYESIRRTYESA